MQQPDVQLIIFSVAVGVPLAVAIFVAMLFVMRSRERALSTSMPAEADEVFPNVRRPGAFLGPLRFVIPCCEAVVPRSFTDGWQALYPHAGEIFFERAPHEKAVYELEIEGVCDCHHGWYNLINATDALYRSREGRFSELHRELKINNRNLGLSHGMEGEPESCETFFKLVERDRARHRYKLHVDDLGEGISISFGSARPDYVHAKLGFLKARVTSLPDGTPGVAERYERERKRKQARKDAVAQAEQLARAVQAVSIRSFTHRNWGDPEYCAKFARAHADEVIRSQAEIRREATAFLEQTELVSYLRKHNSAAVNTILGRLETLIEAERVALDRALAAAEAPKPVGPAETALPAARSTKRLTTGDVRELKLRRQQRDAEDKLALVKDKIAREQDAKKWVTEQYPNLPEDEQTAVYQQVLEELNGDDHGTIL